MTEGLLDFWSKTPAKTVAPVEADIVYGKAENLRVKQSINYIVVGVIFRCRTCQRFKCCLKKGNPDKETEVLLIQETDGTWYLPAGRMEAGETIEEGMKREVKEEAGVECESFGLIGVESSPSASHFNWYRFIYLAKYTGGNLKTLAQKDSESRQATWVNVDQLLNDKLEKKLPLRGNDIFRVIRLGMSRLTGGNPDENARPCAARTIDKPLVGLFTRLILISRNNVLLHKRRFPLIEYAETQRIGDVIGKFIGAICDPFDGVPDHKVVSVEALPAPKCRKENSRCSCCLRISNDQKEMPTSSHDGFSMTILTLLPEVTLKKTAGEDGYEWTDYSADTELSNCIEFWLNNYADFYHYCKKGSD